MTIRTLTVKLVDLTGESVGKGVYVTILEEKSSVGALATEVVLPASDYTDITGTVSIALQPSNPNTEYIARATQGGKVVMNQVFQMPDSDAFLHDLV